MGDIDILIPKKHVKALEFKSDFTPDIRANRAGKKIKVGFSRNNEMEGLGFKLLEQHIVNEDTGSGSTLLQRYMVSERGLYNGSKLDGLGERRFQNNNVYIG